VFRVKISFSIVELGDARVLSSITPVLVKNCAAGYLIGSTRAGTAGDISARGARGSMRV